jgi:hypothetical protein
MLKISIWDSFSAARTAADIYEQQAYCWLLEANITPISEKTVELSTK